MNETEQTTVEVPVAGCDDCGNSPQMMMCDMVTREMDLLCWACAMKRIVAMIKAVSEAEESADDAS